MRISQNKYPFDWFLPIRSYIGGKSISFWVLQNWIDAVLTLTLHAIQFTTRAQFRWNLSVFNKPFEEKYWIGSFFNIITKSIPESYLSSKAPFTLWKQQLEFCQHWFGWEFLKIQTHKTYWFCIDFFLRKEIESKSYGKVVFLFILIENWKVWLLIMDDKFRINLVLFWKWKSLLFNKKRE